MALNSPDNESRDVVWRTVKENFNRLNDSCGGNGMFQKLLKVVLQGFTSRYHIGEIEAFFQNSPFPEGEQTISEGNLIKKSLTSLGKSEVTTV